MNKDQIIDGVIGKEGAYVDNPDDKGGPTRWGITQQVARAHGYQGDMRYLPRETAVQIFEADYWFSPRFDQVAKFSPLIAEELMDTGVNMGPSVAAKFLQRWLNAFNLKGTLYPDMVVDGQIGARTISALGVFLAKRGKEGEQALFKALNCSQGNKYLELAEAREANETFVYGWLKERVQ
ncbi:endolysin [Erwinia phage Pastis]|nr:endolysin [Erwinia phage Pastis]